MKKYLFVFFACLPTCTFAIPNKPYDIIDAIVQQSTDDDVAAYGTHNDVLIKTPATSALRTIYAQKHDSNFWSPYTVFNMGGLENLTDNCFINFIYDYYTEYRLFCGTVTDYKSEYPTVTVRAPIQTVLSETE